MTDDELIKAALKVVKKRLRKNVAITSPEDTREYLQLYLAEYKNEVFGAIFVDNRHRIIKTEFLFYGTIDGASIHPRVIVQKALEHNAAALILFHNHPSGVAEPSHADRTITKRIKDACALIDVRILDHFVIGEYVVSLAERGIL